jgi:hypothetical protein
MAEKVNVLVISGSMGSGKTTVLGEASDLLTRAAIEHAAIDLDVLGLYHVTSAPADDLLMRNLSAVWRNYSAAGISRLLLAEALDTIAKRERIRVAIPEAEIVACRLRVDVETMQRRVRVREPGMLQAQFVARVIALEVALDAGRVEDFAVSNDSRSVTAVAREILERAGWL